MHGANRLGGNSLSDLLVFGQRTGAGAADFAETQADVPHVDPTAVRAASIELAGPFGPLGAVPEDGPTRTGTAEDPYRLHEELQATMGALVGIFRTETDLDDAISKIGELRSRWNAVRIGGGRAYNPSWGLVYELRNMMLVSEAIARSARQREESRGAHSRIDYPDPDPAWATRNIAVRLAGEAMEVVTTPLPAVPDELRPLISMESH
jgi:succinate dehydrogenase / fumarate reductase flavoprotein subunit